MGLTWATETAELSKFAAVKVYSPFERTNQLLYRQNFS